MKSRTTAKFRKALTTLPPQVREQARQAYRQFMQDPGHPKFAVQAGSRIVSRSIQRGSIGVIGRWGNVMGRR